MERINNGIVVQKERNHWTRNRRDRYKIRVYMALFFFILFAVGCIAGGIRVLLQINSFPRKEELQKEKPFFITEDKTDTEWNLRLVNFENPIPENYEVKLIEVPGGEQVDERIYTPLMEMLKDAEKLEPVVVSGYRTQKEQQKLYNKKIQEYRIQGYSKEESITFAQQWVAEPGSSEHQIGLAVDINGATYDLYLWLQENSYQYGFIFRYPGDKTAITGVAEEVWHYRYVGKEVAAEIYEEGICLEEYLETISKKE